MVVNVIQGGEQGFNAMIYKQPDQNLLNYLQDNISHAATAFGGMANSFMDQARNMYEKFNNSAVINASKALMMNVGTHLNQNTIYHIDQNNIGASNMMMQHYIMAHPEVDKLYQKNMCYGFQDTYYDLEPDNSGEDRYAYQRVMTGVLQFEKNGDGYINHYSNDDYYEEELCMMDKFSVLDTWSTVANMLANGIDPTDPDLNEL